MILVFIDVDILNSANKLKLLREGERRCPFQQERNVGHISLWGWL